MAILDQYTAGPQRIAILVAGFYATTNGAPDGNDTPTAKVNTIACEEPERTLSTMTYESERGQIRVNRLRVEAPQERGKNHD